MRALGRSDISTTPAALRRRIDPGNRCSRQYGWVVEIFEQTSQNLYSLIDLGGSAITEPSRIAYKILVVDDNETNLQSAEIALESFGHSVRTARSGHEGLTEMRREDFDLVFIDMHMPGLSGLEVSKAYGSSSKRRAPIVMLTADATRAASADAEIPEIAGFLTKPIKPSELQLAVERYARTGRTKTDFENTESQHWISDVMLQHSFSRENYVELLSSGVGALALGKLIDKFVDDANTILDQMKRRAETGDAAGSKRLLHKLKGSAAAMHIDGLLAIVDHYQRLDDNRLCESLLEDVNVLKRSIGDVATEIRRFITENDR